MSVNLHELINAPFGVAEQTLRSAGLWKDIKAKAEDGEAFTVRIEFSVGMDDTIEVVAETPAEARRQAIALVEAEWSGSGHVEIHRAEVAE